MTDPYAGYPWGSANLFRIGIASPGPGLPRKLFRVVPVLLNTLAHFYVGVLSEPAVEHIFICFSFLAGDDELGEEGGDVGETDDADLDDDWGLDAE